MRPKIKSNIDLSRTMIIAFSLLLMGFITSCEESSTNPDDGHMAEIAFSYSPTPAVTGVEITLLFEAEEHGTHVSVGDPACEIHSLGEVSLTEGETGHYQGAHTFTQAGTYDVHFSFMQEGMMMEEEFSITVN